MHRGGSRLARQWHRLCRPDRRRSRGRPSSITQTGTTTTINQQSQNASLNWQQFSVAANETVQFVQPSATSIALNRVIGSEASQIFGRLSANGQVFLINPNGVLFGQGAQVDVGGLVASTLNISDTDFLAGRYKFQSSSATPGSIVNQGTITAASGGSVALLGGQVTNQGTISAHLGTVALAAGSAVSLDFSGRQLMNVQVDAATLGALASNQQLIQADGGTVIMTAAARDALLSTVVNNTGVIEARTVQNQDGVIKLLGSFEGGTVNVGGTLDASALNGGNGGFVETSGASVKVADSAASQRPLPKALPALG
jgi:filamentous hemagglutinin family protein